MQKERYPGRKSISKLEKKIKTNMSKYSEIIKKLKMPPSNWHVSDKRMFLVEQLKTLGIKNEYEAYAIAARIIEK